MLDLPLLNNRWPIALDLGSDSVKMLQLHQVGGRLVARACGRRKLTMGSDGELRRHQTISAVRDLLATRPFRGRAVNIALSCGQLGIDTLRLPPRDEPPRRQELLAEAAIKFDFPLEDDRLKVIRAGQAGLGEHAGDEYILLAAERQTINGLLEMLDEMRLSARHIDAEPVALFRVFQRFLRRRSDRDAVSVVLDVGSQATRVVVARGRRIVHIRGIDIAGRRLTAAVARQLGLSFEEARELRSLLTRQRADGWGDQADGGLSRATASAVRNALRGEAEVLADQVADCLACCRKRFQGLRARRVTITGGQAYDPVLTGLLGERLGVPYAVGRPLQGIDLTSTPFGRQRRSELAEWAVCAGLAIRDWNDPCNQSEENDGEHRLSA